ncbi:MAG TPA: hypothetical protein VK540_18330 [Polyangiaceae bacterium]|jgi:hypothetical protein|nr:hypothetical protein [Polyangiaceae bacterium]
MTTEPTLEHFNRLVGTRTTEATHPASPGLVVHGSPEMTWLEGWSREHDYSQQAFDVRFLIANR